MAGLPAHEPTAGSSVPFARAGDSNSCLTSHRGGASCARPPGCCQLPAELTTTASGLWAVDGQKRHAWRSVRTTSQCTGPPHRPRAGPHRQGCRGPRMPPRRTRRRTRRHMLPRARKLPGGLCWCHVRGTSAWRVAPRRMSDITVFAATHLRHPPRRPPAPRMHGPRPAAVQPQGLCTLHTGAGAAAAAAGVFATAAACCMRFGAADSPRCARGGGAALSGAMWRLT